MSIYKDTVTLEAPTIELYRDIAKYVESKGFKTKYFMLELPRSQSLEYIHIIKNDTMKFSIYYDAYNFTTVDTYTDGLFELYRSSDSEIFRFDASTVGERYLFNKIKKLIK